MVEEKDEKLKEAEAKEIIEQLEELLKKGEKQKIHDVLDSDINSLQDNPMELYKTLEEDLSLHFGEGVQHFILKTLVTKNLGSYKKQYSEDLKEFFQNLIRRYSTPVKNGYQKLYETEDWRFVTTSLRDNYRGIRLVNEILKWSGEKIVFGGTIPSMIEFAQHIVKNVNLNCDKEQIEEYDKQISEQLELLRSEISKLEETLELEKEE